MGNICCANTANMPIKPEDEGKLLASQVKVANLWADGTEALTDRTWVTDGEA